MMIGKNQTNITLVKKTVKWHKPATGLKLYKFLENRGKFVFKIIYIIPNERKYFKKITKTHILKNIYSNNILYTSKRFARLFTFHIDIQDIIIRIRIRTRKMAMQILI